MEDAAADVADIAVIVRSINARGDYWASALTTTGSILISLRQEGCIPAKSYDRVSAGFNALRRHYLENSALVQAVNQDFAAVNVVHDRIMSGAATTADWNSFPAQLKAVARLLDDYRVSDAGNRAQLAAATEIVEWFNAVLVPAVAAAGHAILPIALELPDLERRHPEVPHPAQPPARWDGERPKARPRACARQHASRTRWGGGSGRTA